MYRNTYRQLFKPATETSGPWNPANLPGKDTAGPGDGLRFAFSPNLHPIVFPDTLPEGSDAWAFHHGYTGVSPFRAAYVSDTGSGHSPGVIW
ncbi:hypothetical protein CspHIS471_0500050 [Cutaneotrichosporon sp. HIS471]|nr:hypothetical protein CspHIS471_0500050 [Cutaneotrichosporon sp. HIS471]